MQIGFDLGYGYAKICYGLDYTLVKFPSVVAQAESFENNDRGFGDYTLELDGVRYYIGAAALMSRSKLVTTAFEGDRLNSSIFRALFLAGIGSCCQNDTDVSVVTGLPINAYRLFKHDIEKYRNKYRIILNDKPIILNITSLKVIPQPLGTYFKLLPSYPELESQSLLIVDIGFKTTDLLRMEKERTLPSSTSINFGMSDVARKIISNVNSQIDGRTWTINEVDELLDRGYVKNGVRYYIPQELAYAVLKDTFKAIWSRIVELYPEHGTLDRIIFTGGSSIRFKPFINDLPYDSMGIASDPQMANAIGYREVLELGI